MRPGARSIRTVISAAAALVKVMAQHAFGIGPRPAVAAARDRSARGSCRCRRWPSPRPTASGSAERRCAGVGGRKALTAPPPCRATRRCGRDGRSRCGGRDLGPRDRQVGAWPGRRNGRSAAAPRPPPRPGSGAGRVRFQRVLLQAGDGLAALELHEQEECRLGLCDPVEAAALGDQRLDRELRRQPAGDVPAIGYRPGLVVDRRPIRPSRAVSMRSARARSLNGPPGASKHELAFDGACHVPSMARRRARTCANQVGDALGSAATISPHTWGCAANSARKLARPMPQQLGAPDRGARRRRSGGRTPASTAWRIWPRSAPPGSASSGSSGRSCEDPAGIDGVGIAHQPLDVGYPELARPGREPAGAVRAARRGRGGPPAGRAVLAQAATPGSAAMSTSRSACSEQRLQPYEPARRYRGRAVLVLGGAAEHHFRRVPATARKSCAAMPIACSAGGRPRRARIARLSQGPASAGGGQMPSLSPPRMTRSASISRASI